MGRRRVYCRTKPVKASTAYAQLWRVVEGAVADCFNMHPDYLTPKGAKKSTAQRSLTKRVTGAVLGYAEQSARAAASQPDRSDG